jgi:hypothetical protein
MAEWDLSHYIMMLIFLYVYEYNCQYYIFEGL